MTTKTERLLEVQNRVADLSDEGLSSVYMKVLHQMWNGQWATAANTAAEHLAEDPDCHDSLELYRAWIEALAQLEDHASLAALSEHLLVLGRETPELRQTFMAMRGLIHIELDQAPAIRLLSRALSGRIHNPYCLEFEQMCVRRGFSQSVIPITQATGNISDYFVWNTLLTDLACEGRQNELHECLKHVSKVFPGSPDVAYFGMHLAFEQKQWQAALVHAQNLARSFPAHPDFTFHTAFAAFQANNLDLAIHVIESVDASQRDTDVDLTNLYGQCLAARFERDENDDDAHAAIRLLTDAARSMRRFGLDVHKNLDLIQKMEEQVGGHTVPDYAQNQFRAPRSWMVVLSPRRCEEMVNASDDEIEKLHRPLGAEAAPGDVVLFVARAAHTLKKPVGTRQEWRVLSMYRVTSRPYWHAQQRWNSSLELIDRPEHPVPIDTEELKSDIDIRGKRSSLPRGHHARFGVYSLDDSAMDIMISALKRRTAGIEHDKERRGEAFTKQKPV